MFLLQLFTDSLPGRLLQVNLNRLHMFSYLRFWCSLPGTYSSVSFPWFTQVFFKFSLETLLLHKYTPWIYTIPLTPKAPDFRLPRQLFFMKLLGILIMAVIIFNCNGFVIDCLQSWCFYPFLMDIWAGPLMSTSSNSLMELNSSILGEVDWIVENL